MDRECNNAPLMQTCKKAPHTSSIGASYPDFIAVLCYFVVILHHNVVFFALLCSHFASLCGCLIDFPNNKCHLVKRGSDTIYHLFTLASPLAPPLEPGPTLHQIIQRRIRCRVDGIGRTERCCCCCWCFPNE